MAKIGSARIDENGHISGGVAGDQNSKEVAEEEFYFHKKKWLAFKPRSKEHALALAKSMKESCANENIGYDQAERLGVFTWVNSGFKIKNISKPTECDCSALVRACILEATGVSLLNFNTSSEPNVLKNSGLFEPAFEVKSLHDLEVGMILCTSTKGHTAIVTEANPPTGATIDTPTKKEEVGKLQASKYFDKSVARTYKTNAKTTLRYGAGDLKMAVMDVSAGTSVKCHGYYNLVGKEKWLCVVCNGRTGYIKEKALDR